MARKVTALGRGAGTREYLPRVNDGWYKGLTFVRLALVADFKLVSVLGNRDWGSAVAGQIEGQDDGGGYFKWIDGTSTTISLSDGRRVSCGLL